MTTGEQGRTPPDAEHYLDLSDVPEESPGPQFDTVLRGYDRRQVDEHVAGLRRMVAQLRAQLAVHERRRAGTPDAGDAETGPMARSTVAGPVPEARRAPSSEIADGGAGVGAEGADDGGGDGPDMVGAFNDRLRGILQAAEQEAQLVRSRAAESLLAEHAESRAALADLRAQRDAVFDELIRVKSRLDDLVSNSGRPSPYRGPWPAGPGRPARPVGPGGAPVAPGAPPGPPAPPFAGPGVPGGGPGGGPRGGLVPVGPVAPPGVGAPGPGGPGEPGVPDGYDTSDELDEDPGDDVVHGGFDDDGGFGDGGFDDGGLDDGGLDADTHETPSIPQN